MQNTSRTNRLILTILAVVVGLFMVIVAPLLIQTSLERVIGALLEVSKQKPAYASGILLFSFAYPFYRGLIFIGGVMLLLFAKPIYEGRAWAYPASLLAAAFPSAGGMFMFLPYISFVDGFPIPMAISLVGLIYFWSAIFLRKADPWEKWGHFVALTFAGMLTTHAFTIGIGNLRMLLTRPEKPLYAGFDWWVLAWSAPVQWIAVILLFIAIYKLAEAKRIGWWLMLIAAASIFAIDVPTQIIRTFIAYSDSLDYLYGSLLSGGLLFSLFFPRFRIVELSKEPE
ncbi:MAG: hypothetical protein RBS68_13400 [Anaerolineales bacterium]|jgi:hypothetical protein|nr:hypothetical protein [Anaerolineales bacterium]